LEALTSTFDAFAVLCMLVTLQAVVDGTLTFSSVFAQKLVITCVPDDHRPNNHCPTELAVGNQTFTGTNTSTAAPPSPVPLEDIGTTPDVMPFPTPVDGTGADNATTAVVALVAATPAAQPFVSTLAGGVTSVEKDGQTFGVLNAARAAAVGTYAADGVTASGTRRAAAATRGAVMYEVPLGAVLANAVTGLPAHARAAAMQAAAASGMPGRHRRALFL
jgi:hypothetical protein